MLIHYRLQTPFRFRKRWQEPRHSDDCDRCGRKISARYTGENRSGTRRIRNRITDRLKIRQVGANGSRLVLTDFDPLKDSGVYRCFANRISKNPGNPLENIEPIFMEAEVRIPDYYDQQLN